MTTYCVTLCEEGLHVRKDEWDGWELVTEVQNFAIVPYQGPPITAGTDSHHIAGIVATELRLPEPDSVDHDGEAIYMNYAQVKEQPPAEFMVDLDKLTATHNPTGIVWTFKKLKDGSYDGRATVRDKSIKSDAQALARLSREAGDAFIGAINDNERNRNATN